MVKVANPIRITKYTPMYTVSTWMNVSPQIDSNFNLLGVAIYYIRIIKTRLEDRIVPIIEKNIKEIVEPEIDKRKSKVNKYVDEKAPQYKFLLSDIYQDMPERLDDENIEDKFTDILHCKKKQTAEKAEELVGNINTAEDFTSYKGNAGKILQKLNDINKANLALYVSYREHIINLLEKKMEYAELDIKKYHKEQEIHRIIFPLGKNSENLDYRKHNLWLIDESLVFSRFITSDQRISESGRKPDIVVYHNLLFREREEPSCPITIYEFKRPGRTTYNENSNPIKQIYDYVLRIRANKIKTETGRRVQTHANTLAYGYLVCDINEKVKEICERESLHPTPDGEGYIGFHPTYKILIQVISFDRLLRNSKRRNEIFFKQLKKDTIPHSD